MSSYFLYWFTPQSRERQSTLRLRVSHEWVCAHACSHSHIEAHTCTLHMCTLLPCHVCHQMSPPSASFNLAENPVIILQMATSTFSVSLTLFFTFSLSHSLWPAHFHTLFFSVPHSNLQIWLQFGASMSLTYIMAFVGSLTFTNNSFIHFILQLLKVTGIFNLMLDPQMEHSSTILWVLQLNPTHERQSNGWSLKVARSYCFLIWAAAAFPVSTSSASSVQFDLIPGKKGFAQFSDYHNQIKCFIYIYTVHIK